MAEIVNIAPVQGNKSAILHEMSDRSRVYHCRGPHNPVYFDAGGGALSPIDMAAIKDAYSQKVNGIYLRDKNIRSVGIRRDGLKNKYLGLRPDDNQSGAEQLEFTLERIEFDGREVAPDISKHEAIDAVTADLGNVVVRSTRQGCRQMVKVSSPIKGFRIIFTIHLKGLDLRERADLGEWWLYSSKTGEFRFRIRRPLFINAETFEPLPDVQHLIQHSLADNGDGTLTYTKQETAGFAADLLPESYYIDVDTVYSSTSDGYIYIYGITNWTATRNAASGNSVNTSSSYNFPTIQAKFSDGSASIYRSFFYYNLSGLEGTVSNVSENIRGYSNTSSDACTQKGTQGSPLATTDYSYFTGNYYASVSWIITGYNIFTYSPTGVSDVNAGLGGLFKTCLREYSHDYLNSDPGGSAYGGGGYFAEQIGVTRDPYLSITMLDIGAPHLGKIMKTTCPRPHPRAFGI